MSSRAFRKCAVIFVLTMASVLPVEPVRAQSESRFKVAPGTEVIQLLPALPVALAKMPVLIHDDLNVVPDVMLATPLSNRQARNRLIEMTEDSIFKANYLNTQNRDGFIKALTARRTDLSGLPFRMGDDCRTCVEQARVFTSIATSLRRTVNQVNANRQPGNSEFMNRFWDQLYRSSLDVRKANKNNTKNADEYDRAAVAVGMQILGAERASFRIGLAQFLARIAHADAAQALARLAIFSTEEDVRTAAIQGLKSRRIDEYTNILMQGFHYPLPAVAQRSADALVKLSRKDLVADLVQVLDEPDPRLPVKKWIDGEEVSVIREVVRLNHHRNCLLCHAPGNMKNVPAGVLKVAVPLPTDSLQPVYYDTPPPSLDMLVRIDTTYLRQDFSLMMPVPDAKPWPERQRFDFLVRTRHVTPALAVKWEQELAHRGQLSPYHHAANNALRLLTGLEAAPTARAWREALHQ